MLIILLCYRELDNLLTKLDVLKMLFETASGVSFRSSTLQRKSTSEVSHVCSVIIVTIHGVF